MRIQDYIYVFVYGLVFLDIFFTHIFAIKFKTRYDI